jgi:hypothetical protein
MHANFFSFELFYLVLRVDIVSGVASGISGLRAVATEPGNPAPVPIAPVSARVAGAVLAPGPAAGLETAVVRVAQLAAHRAERSKAPSRIPEQAPQETAKSVSVFSCA